MSNAFRTPSGLSVLALLGLCAAPWLLNLAAPLGPDSGTMVHVLLEWTGVCAALFVGLLTLFLFRQTRRPEVSILGVALLAVGTMDAFHALAGSGAVPLVAPQQAFVPFTWASSRLFNGLILLGGLLIAWRIRDRAWEGPAARASLAGASAAFALLGCAVIWVCARWAPLPETIFADAAVPRPYDLAPVPLFAGAAFVLWRGFVRDNPSPFGVALLLSLIPAIGTQMHMAFGSVALYDGAFNGAHALKTLSYAIPLAGVLVEFQNAYRELGDQRETLARLNRELDYQVTHDALTGLANRAFFIQHAERMLARAGRAERPAAMLFLDLDGFKEINDALGHEAGDHVLRLAGHRMDETVRRSDVCARLGGDQFAVLLADLPRREDAGIVASKLVDAIGLPGDLDGQELLVTPSIGVALFPENGATAEDLLRAADRAMYAAKTRGGSGFEYFDAEMDQSAKAVVSMRSDVRRALERREFCLHFQPQVHIDGSAVAGCEALVRWNHPERGMVPPFAFIDIAERTGLIVDLGHWILEDALDHQRRWHDSLGPLRMGINVSFRQVRELDFPDRVLAAIRHASVDPGLVELELTESWIVGDLDRTLAHLQPLKALGVRLSVDDFGTGYSTLGSLEQLPIDAMKIDRSFVREIDTDRGHQTIAQALLTMARGLELDVVAEGIETEAERAVLEGYGVREAQGYLFSRPLAAPDFEQWADGRDIKKA